MTHHPSDYEHLIALAAMWGTAAIIVAAGLLATLVSLGAARLRRTTFQRPQVSRTEQ